MNTAIDDDFYEIQRLATLGFWEKIDGILDSNSQLINHRDSFGGNLLVYLSAYPGAYRTIKKLIAEGAEVNIVTSDGESPITKALLGGEKFGESTKDIISLLISNNLELNFIGPSGYPPLHWAIYHNKINYAKILLESGADPYLKTNDLYPENAFDIAEEEKNHEALSLLNSYKRKRD